jgi:hypothetical protein
MARGHVLNLDPAFRLDVWKQNLPLAGWQSDVDLEKSAR